MQIAVKQALVTIVVGIISIFTYGQTNSFMAALALLVILAGVVAFFVNKNEPAPPIKAEVKPVSSARPMVKKSTNEIIGQITNENQFDSNRNTNQSWRSQ